jgi:hypothetical protein
MKNIKIFIITYKREDVLNQLLDNIFNSDFKHVPNTEVNIINNHSNFKMNEKYKDLVKVYHNDCRPDWSGANLGESWNQALLLGFKSLRNPDSKYVVTLQNDCVLHKNWCSHLLKMHKKYNFVAGEFGDNIVSYTADAVKNIGIWDEQFSGGGHREADYYLRALRFNKEKSLINDTMHKRVWNPNNDYLTLDIPDGRNINKELKRRPDNKEHEQISVGIRGGCMNAYNTEYFIYKWSGTHSLPVQKQTWIKNWPDELKNNPPKIKKEIVFMKYPYFEKDISKLEKKGYWIPNNFSQERWDEWERKTKQSNSDTY